MEAKEAIEKDLKTAHAIFKTCKMPFILYHGNLLGFVKYGRIMEWDTDVDLAVTEKVTFDDKRCLAARFHKAGFTVFARGSAMRFHRNVDVDVFFFHLKGVWYVKGNSGITRFKRAYPRAFFDDPKEMKFLGMKFLVPRPTEDYLEWEYGPRWKTDLIQDKATWKRFVQRRREAGHW